jgi:hypothetical protein
MSTISATHPASEASRLSKSPDMLCVRRSTRAALPSSMFAVVTLHTLPFATFSVGLFFCFLSLRSLSSRSGSFVRVPSFFAATTLFLCVLWKPLLFSWV